MSNKCTGIMGRIFGNKMKACVFYEGDLIVSRHLSTIDLAEIKERQGISSDCKIAMICLRCGAVTGEKR